MAEYVFINKISNYVQQTVTLKGWINNIRSSGKIYFLELRDGSGFIQVVANVGELADDTIARLKELTRESSVEAAGTVTEHPKNKGVFELQLKEIKIYQRALDYPIEKKDHGPDFLLQHRHLWLRSKKQWAIQRIRNTIINATYDFFRKENFIKFDSPIITSAACEGTTTLFALDYFDLGKAYLSQSGQLYLEAALAAHGRIFDFGPVFRAEKSKTKKHLIEFWMMDAEAAFVEFEQNLEMQENMVCFMLEQVLTQHERELVILERDVSKLASIKKPFDRITHKEAVKLLQKAGSSITEEIDLGANDEQLLAGIFSGPVFITKWPANIKAFYMKRCPDDPNYVLAADLMAPEGFGEMIGGSQREDDYNLLLERMEEEKMPIDQFEWFLDTRRYGSIPHSGFGFGLERLVTWFTGCQHIRETIPFPRLLYRFTP